MGEGQVMVRINFIVEGQTEETFVNTILCPHLSAHGIYPSARCVETGRHGSRIYRGGLLRYDKAKRDISRWLNEDPSAYVTTMFDYYGLPNDFPGLRDAETIDDAYEKVKTIQDAMSQDIGEDRFIPYIQLHEFEALLFSDVASIDRCMELFGQHGEIMELENILSSFDSPEHINNSRETAPSKRLKEVYPAYDKVFLGGLVPDEIGLTTIAEKCPHFNGWLDTILNLSA